jgi:23S rRNA pseudouridine2605 synthase
MRLVKYLAHAGIASRRASEQLIFAGRVTIGGEVVRDPARDVDGSEAITVDDRPVRTHDTRRLVFAVNKPVGVVSTVSDPQGRPTVVQLVSSGRRLYPVGRLDADTTGLILLTDDGALAHHLTHPSFEVPRTYVAKVHRPPLRETELKKLREGVELDDGVTLPARARRLAPDEVELTIREGRKRQVRRMLDAVGHPVISLRRVSFGTLELGSLEEGQSRRLTESEIDRLRGAASGAATATAVRAAFGARGSSRSSGRPSSGGRPPSGRPSSGRPSSGRPSSGRPSSERPPSGRPSSERPSSGRPSSGRPPSGRRPARPGAGRRGPSRRAD